MAVLASDRCAIICRHTLDSWTLMWLACKLDFHPEKKQEIEKSLEKKMKLTHSIPFCHHSLFLEARKLSTIVNRRQKLPKKQHRHTDQHDRGNDSKDNAQKENFRRTFGSFLRSHTQRDGSVLLNSFAVHKLITAIVFIVERAEMFIVFFVVWN